MSETHIAVVLGTARVDRQSEKVAHAIVDIIEGKEGASAELADVRELVTKAVTVPPWGEGGANDEPTEWKRIVERSQALMLVVPEYNHGYPGELKLLLDSLWDAYGDKPVVLVGVSGGTLGGARVVDHIKPVLIELHLRPLREAVYISKVKEVFVEDGTFADAKTVEYIEKAVDALRAAA